MSIWIDPDDYERVIKKIKATKHGEAIYEGYKIDELYIEDTTGDLAGWINIGDIGVSIEIDFGDWFKEFIRLKAFEDLEYFLTNHQEKVKKILEGVQKCNSIICGLSETPDQEEKP